MTKQQINLRRTRAHPEGLDPVERINAITRNARASWAGLVAVLLFVGVTLLGFEHIDFYGIDEQTTLPVVGVSVPTRFFFYAAPVLAAASYIYFHLYLLRLWSALATAPARIKGAPLSDATPVWLLIDAALWLRNLVRRDGSSGERALEGISALVNIALAWGFGLVVVGYAWWISATARDLWMTGLTALMWLAMIATAISSLGTLWRRVAHNRPPRPAYFATATFFLCAPLLAFPSYWRTTEPAPWLPRPGEKVADDWQNPYPLLNSFAKLAPINLVGEQIVRKPDNWLPHDIQMDEFRVNYCKRKAIAPCTLEGDTQNDFDAEWQTRWQARLAALPKPKWHNPGQVKPDLRHANLTEAFLAGIDLNRVRMQMAVLNDSQLESANLSFAQMQGTKLIATKMQRAHLARSNLQHADLSESNLQSAQLDRANLEGAVLYQSQLQLARLIDTRMPGADLTRANLFRAQMQNARLEGAILRRANLERASMERAQLQNATLESAKLQNAWMRSTNLEHAQLSGANLEGANLAYANLSHTDLARARMNGAQLSFAILNSSHMRGAQLKGTNFAFAELNNAMMRSADLDGARLDYTDLTRANLGWASLEGASFEKALLQETLFTGAHMNDSSFENARLNGTDMRFVELGRANFTNATLEYVVVSGSEREGNNWGLIGLTASRAQGAAIRQADLSSANPGSEMFWRNVFLDGSVKLPDKIKSNLKKPCQWVEAHLTSAAYFGHWRGWIETNPEAESWRAISPQKWIDVTPIPPPEGCEWKTGPMHGAAFK